MQMTRQQRFADLMKSDAEIRTLTARWAAINQDIGRRDERMEGAPAPAAGEAPPGLAGQSVQGLADLRALKGDREACARQYNAREEALRAQAGL